MTVLVIAFALVLLVCVLQMRGELTGLLRGERARREREQASYWKRVRAEDRFDF